MKPSSTTLIAAAGVIILALIAWALMRNGADTLPVENTTDATTTPVGSTGTNGTPKPTGGSPSTANSSSGLGEWYTNTTHNFSISYPREMNAEAFGNFHRLNQNDWRYAASAAYRGTPVVSIPVIRVDNQAKNLKNYPLFYAAEVRVGVSTDTANCYAKDDGYTNQTVTNVTIGGVTWKKFSFGDAAMQQYVNGASYRTVHNNKCYVIEQIENGSSYRDETLVGGYTDADLDVLYAKTTPIVMSFKFTK